MGEVELGVTKTGSIQSPTRRGLVISNLILNKNLRFFVVLNFKLQTQVFIALKQQATRNGGAIKYYKKRFKLPRSWRLQPIAEDLADTKPA
jgi:hypothetical protein